ncbi:hypothetical protein ACFVVA_40975 [Kitasatospora sp. NPDC058048]|uniref:hypothetical protein n=1 Tax=Kitasatospora sp. NPDC058048 TaxID=3346313 RepID=UPI0036D8058A
MLGSEKPFYQVGDCGFGSAGHHSPPNRRLATASWAASAADDTADQGHILPLLQFYGPFGAELPDLVKPDASNRSPCDGAVALVSVVAEGRADLVRRRPRRVAAPTVQSVFNCD